jgi:purine-binding chemotaxis protein CheW
VADQKHSQPIKENVVDAVLQDYLDQLLVTATAPATPQVEVAANPVQRVNKVINVEEVVPVAEAIPVEVLPDIKELTPEEDIKVDMVATTAESVEMPLHATAEEVWATTGVECLLFSVAGLKLAVPLPLLGGVHEIGDHEISPLFGQPEWYLGLCQTEQGSVQVIDTAKFIMPERGNSLKEAGFNYLIQLDKSPWVMGCQSIDDTVRLEASEIKWRGDRGKRPWLAGTVIDKMCALLDVAGLLELVESSCKPVRISQN